MTTLRVRVETEWEHVRCWKCSKLILKITPGALREGGMAEALCWRCDSKNYIVGQPTTDAAVNPTT